MTILQAEFMITFIIITYYFYIWFYIHYYYIHFFLLNLKEMKIKHFLGPCKSRALGTVLIVPNGEADPACYSAWLMTHAIHGIMDV